MNNIIILDTLRIDRNKPRKCTCTDRKFTVDKNNREVTCECGMTEDPFEALLYLAEHYERLNRQHESLDEQRRQWIKEKPHSVVFKQLERSYRKGTMLPSCPECGQTFDYKDISGHTNAEYFRAWKAKHSQ